MQKKSINNLLYDNPRIALKDPFCIRVYQNVAAKIGLNESIVLDLLNRISEANKIINTGILQQYLPFWSPATTSRALAKLKDLHLVDIIETDKQEIEEVLRSKHLDGYGIGNNICDWCGIKTIVLHEHHFPIPKKDGGEKTVGICPNCHYEFHAMENKIMIDKIQIERHLKN